MQRENFQTLANAAAQHGFNDQQERLKQQIADLEDKLFVMIVGEGKMGKSTLINTLVGKKIAPVSVIPKTWKVDIYQKAGTNEEEHALLYFRNNPQAPQRLSLTAAETRIRQEEEKKEQGQNSDLFQVRFIVHWPEQTLPNNIALVDTPGYRQERGESNVNARLYGAQGIEIEGDDPFQYFYHRSEIVLWCIRGNKIHDKDTQQFLESVAYQQKPIVGVLTWMDQIPETRWTAIGEEAGMLHKKYIQNFVFTAFGSNETLKQKTLQDLQTRLLTLLQKSGEKSILKQKNYEVEQTLFVQQLDAIVEVYRKNTKAYYHTIQRLESDAENLEKAILKEISEFWYSVKNQALQKIDALWQQSAEDIDNFQDLVIENSFDRSSIRRFSEQQVNKSAQRLNQNTNTTLQQVNWTALQLKSASHAEKKVALAIHYPTFSCDYDHNFSFHLSGDEGDGHGLLAGGAGALLGAALLGPIGLAGAALFSVGKQWGKKQESIKKAKRAISDFCESKSSGLQSAIQHGIHNYLKDSINAVNQSFLKHHGRDIKAVLKHVYAADQSLSDIAWPKTTIALPPNLFQAPDNYPQGKYSIDFIQYDAEKIQVWEEGFKKLFQHLFAEWLKKQKNALAVWEKTLEHQIDQKALNNITFMYPETFNIKASYQNHFQNNFLNYLAKAKDTSGNSYQSKFIADFQTTQESLVQEINLTNERLYRRAEKVLDGMEQTEIRRLQEILQQAKNQCKQWIKEKHEVFSCTLPTFSAQTWLTTLEKQYPQLDQKLFHYIRTKHQQHIEKIHVQIKDTTNALKACFEKQQVVLQIREHHSEVINKLLHTYQQMLKNRKQYEQLKEKFIQKQLPLVLQSDSDFINRLFAAMENYATTEGIEKPALENLMQQAEALIAQKSSSPQCLESL
jgi:ribosome biogenesis GTPase A